MGEYSALCEKVLRTLENILERDQGIREFAIVQTSENHKNKSPVLYEENCLGLESWCKPYIQSYSHNILLKQRKKLSRKQLSTNDMRNLNHVLSGGLFVQPSVVTFWNMKRELVEYGVLNIEQELYFNELILSMYSKSYEAFSYRKWLLSLKIGKTKDTNFFDNERKICEITASKSQNNYHSWNFRIWCMEILKQIHPEIETFIFSELNFSLDWISKHISEYTGYNYRQYLLNSLKNMKSLSYTICEIFNFNNAIKYLNLSFCDEDPFIMLKFLFGKSLSHSENDAYPKYINMVSILLNDLTFISYDLNYLYKNHECLWIYRKFLIIQLIELIYDYHDMKMDHKLFIKPKHLNHHPTVNILSLDIGDLGAVKSELPKKITSCNIYTLLMKKELEFIDANKSTADSSSFDIPQRYSKWLNLMNFVFDKN